MKARHWSMAGAVLAGCLLVACSTAPLPPDDRAPAAPGAAPPGFSGVLRASLPSVLGVYGLAEAPEAIGKAQATQATRGQEAPPWSDADAPTNIGAGFFIDDSGYFVTAGHVVAEARQVLVKTADLRVFEADLVGHDEEADVALMHVPDMVSPVPRFGRSASSRAGDWVLAIGEPFGLQRSVVAGIVAGRARHFSEDGGSFYIQSDLSLNPGNSGGPLLNAEGEIVGMNIRTVVGSFGTPGVSLSIPIEAVLQIAAELRGGDPRVRPRLGAGFEDVSASAALAAGRRYASGAMITSVREQSVARQLGLQVGDIVVGVDGQPVEDSSDFARWLMRWRSVEGTRLVVWREQRYRLLEAP